MWSYDYLFQSDPPALISLNLSYYLINNNITDKSNRNNNKRKFKNKNNNNDSNGNKNNKTNINNDINNKN